MKDNINTFMSDSPITSPNDNLMGGSQGFDNSEKINKNPARFKFIQALTSLFGYKKKSRKNKDVKDNIVFTKVDADSNLRLAQAKAGRLFNTKLTGKLGDLFDAWLQDTTDSYRTLEDRNKRIAELEFAISNDPFLSQAADLYADEATQIDVQGKLIQIDCADPRMKERMEDLLDQWGVTQNRLRSVAYNLASYGDAFWANKVTKNGVVRINPLGVHQVKERLEFNPVQVQTDLDLQKGYLSAINRDAKLKALFDTIENEENEEFADLFDTRLFGFAIGDDLVVPPWTVTHFRLNSDQSEFFPMGRPIFLKALAPFRQCNATMVLQSLARVQSFPVTVYTVKTAPGMDEALQFEKINMVREEYENIGETGAGTEAFSVNTKIWAPEGLISLEMHSPDIDINATNDIEMYQDRVAIASGIPKGYLVQEWGGYGNSAISLVEQFKPFARKVFTVQSAILDGLTNLFRLHFAITGEFDYRESFILSMKFPNEETSDARQTAKQNSLNLTKDVLETIASVVGAINDPLPSEVIKDVLEKYSFLDPEDIKRWIKTNPNQVEHSEDEPEDLSGDEGLGGGSIGGEIGGGDMNVGEEVPFDASDLEAETPPEAEATPTEESRKRYINLENKFRLQERSKQLVERYNQSKEIISEKIIREFKKIDECSQNNRHFKYAHFESCNIPMYNMFQKDTTPDGTVLREELSIGDMMKEGSEGRLNWGIIKKQLNEEEEEKENRDNREDLDDLESDETRQNNLNNLLS